MTQNENNGRGTPVLTFSTRDNRLHSRVFRTMILTTALAMLGSVFFTSVQVTSGLLIGGLLALLNHRWLQTSISAAFGVLVNGETPRVTLTKYIIRYFVVGMVVFVAYTFGIASFPAMIAGLCTFVVALFVEAIREMYFAITHREEIS